MYVSKADWLNAKRRAPDAIPCTTDRNMVQMKQQGGYASLRHSQFPVSWKKGTNPANRRRKALDAWNAFFK